MLALYLGSLLALVQATFAQLPTTEQPYPTMTSDPLTICSLDRFGRSMCGVPTTSNTRTYSYDASVASLSCTSNTSGRGQECSYVPELIEGCYYDADGSLLCFGTATTPAEICDYDVQGSTSCSAYISSPFPETGSTAADFSPTSATVESVSAQVTTGTAGRVATPSQTSESAAASREDVAYLIRGAVGGVVVVAGVALLWMS